VHLEDGSAKSDALTCRRDPVAGDDAVAHGEGRARVDVDKVADADADAEVGVRAGEVAVIELSMILVFVTITGPTWLSSKSSAVPEA
jgi:hypothetical protein